jgi:predicted nuclease of predicted toxin-antitoxin system
MRFLANENIPGPVVAMLREHGHDVFWVKESMAGAADPVVLALAQEEHRVIVTADTDFGELAFHSRLPAQSGVILIRLDWKDPDSDNDAVVKALMSRDDWSGNFAVVERDRVRIRPLPDAGDELRRE